MSCDTKKGNPTSPCEDLLNTLTSTAVSFIPLYRNQKNLSTILKGFSTMNIIITEEFENRLVFTLKNLLRMKCYHMREMEKYAHTH